MYLVALYRTRSTSSSHALLAPKAAERNETGNCRESTQVPYYSIIEQESHRAYGTAVSRVVIHLNKMH